MTATHSEVVTPSDTVNLKYICSSIFVGTGGDVAAVNENGSSVLLHTNVPSGTYIWGEFSRVNATDTTASDMIASRGIAPVVREPAAIDLPALAALGGLYEVNLGTLNAADVAANGPRTLYSLPAGSFAYASKAFAPNEFTDADSGLYIGVLSELIDDASSNAFGVVDSDTTQAQYGDPALDGYTVITRELTRLLIGPAVIVAAWNNDGGMVATAPVAWQALHAFASDVWTIQNDVANSDRPAFWKVTGSGTSGASAPTWDSGGDVTDGSVTWTFEGFVPTTGSATFSITVSKAA